MKISWHLGVLIGIFLLLVGLYPQLKLWSLRGASWNGVYAYNDLDEAAYAAYLQALIDGRARRNDPFTGRDDAPGAPQPESLFSIQFLPAYVVAIPARAFGLSSSTALILTSAIAAFTAALALFWLIAALTGDSLFAAAASLFVLCCGVLAIGEGAVIAFAGNYAAYPYFPFLRRYVPAVPFPLFFVFCGAVWQMLIGKKRRQRALFGVAAAASFASLVYSYFYLWTTAAAWLVCAAIVWLTFRPAGWQRDLRRIMILWVLIALSLVPYFVLLANRAAAIDSVQLLVFTRAPDLLRPPLVWSLLALTLLSFGVWRGRVESNDKLALFAAAFALAPFAVFNQQIVTGRALQPVHYQVFIANYVALLAFALAAFALWRGRNDGLSRANLILPLVASLAIVWGVIEAHITTRVLDDANVVRDESKAAGDYLKESAKTELFDEENNRRMVLSLNLIQGDDLPSTAPQAVLWARHAHVFTGAGEAENLERFHQFLYYAGVDAEQFENQLRGGNIVYVISLFGWGRHTPRLTSDYKPLTNPEILNETLKFAEYAETFDFDKAARYQLSFVVADADSKVDFTNLDRWYERGEGKRIGKFVLYRVKLRPR